MACPLPCVLGTLSDSAKLKFSNINSQLAELIYLAVIIDNFDTLNAWTETDADEKVNLSNGMVSMDGGGAWTHGLCLTTGISRAVGYFEIKWQINNVAIDSEFAINGALAFPGTPAQYDYIGALTHAGYNATTVGGYSTVVAGTWYTVRIYIALSAQGTYNRFWYTIQGGLFVNETIYASTDYGTLVPATMYPILARYASSPTKLTYFKEFRWYSGYSTASPYVEYVHDAGAGKIFNNLDFTAFALPGSVPSTNLTFKYSFDDGAASYSAALTLAQLNAVGKITANHRYIRIQTLANSDGATQVYLDKPNSDTATDGIGDFPDFVNVFTADTVQGATGTGTQPSAPDLRSGVQCGIGGTGVTGTRKIGGSVLGDFIIGGEVNNGDN